MRKVKILSILLMICLLVSILFQTAINKVYAESKNEVTLNFEGGIIHDGSGRSQAHVHADARGGETKCHYYYF